MAGLIERLASEEDAATMIEYVLLVGLIAAALVTVVSKFGAFVGSELTTATTALGGS